MNTPQKPPVRPSAARTPIPASTETPGAESGPHTGAQRIRLDDLTSNTLDALYERLDAAETAVAELTRELDGRTAEARKRWIEKQLDETGLRAMDFRNGMAMEIAPARELVAHWVGAARAMLGDAPNYTETPVEMEVKVGESPERYAFVLQRVGRLTPHEARQQAEAERDALRYRLDSARDAAALHRQGLVTDAELYAVIEAHADPSQPNPGPTGTPQDGPVALSAPRSAPGVSDLGPCREPSDGRTDEGPICGSEPSDDEGREDCWCTLPPGHDGECVCGPCRERYGAPGWTAGPRCTCADSGDCFAPAGHYADCPRAETDRPVPAAEPIPERGADSPRAAPSNGRATERTMCGPARQASSERCRACGHTKADHSGRRDHHERYGPLVAGDPWCHACEATCDYDEPTDPTT